MSKTRVLIADDHPMMRQGIRHLLGRQRDLEVVGEASNGEQVVSLAEELAPDVVIMDIGMPGVNGLEATKRIKASNPAIAIIIFTVYDEAEYVLRLLEAGADGYLLKDAYGTQLLQAVRAVKAGGSPLQPAVVKRLLTSAGRHRAAKRLAGQMKKRGSDEYLTPREIEVLQLAAKGLTNRGIGAELDIGAGTVKWHLLSIFAKLGVNSRTEAVLHAMKRGWINSSESSPGGSI
jgi:DNA-binding NarL/FixJ family response regulator